MSKILDVLQIAFEGYSVSNRPTDWRTNTAYKFENFTLINVFKISSIPLEYFFVSKLHSRCKIYALWIEYLESRSKSTKDLPSFLGLLKHEEYF